MNRKRLAALLAAGVVGGALLITGCASKNDDSVQQPPTPTADGNRTHDAGSGSTAGGHSGMHHSPMVHPMDGGPALTGMKAAVNAKYPVGATVTLTADHMGGMKGAKATIVGAYTTYAYAVNFTPTTGGSRVTDHKWVVQEEIKDAGNQRLPDGTAVTLHADHMQGMNGAKATIASSTTETVYMVDYDADGMTMKNHKWVVESEIEPTS